MELKADVSEALDEWLKIDTWHTSHPLDMNRFYGFVDQYAKHHGYSLNESELAEEIQSRHKVNELLMQTVRDHISLMYNILDFLKATSR